MSPVKTFCSFAAVETPRQLMIVVTQRQAIASALAEASPPFHS